MANVQFANYISTSLAAPASTVATTLLVANSAGMPATAGGQYFYLTLVDLASVESGLVPPAQREIVKVTGVAGNVLTVERGQDGTAAQAWAIADVVELRLNAAALSAIQGGEYIAPFPNSVPRTSQSKFSDTVSVKDFGAVGDGVTDDTVAVQAAFDAGAGRVLFPHATYRITNTVTFLGADRSVIDGDGSSLVLDEASGTKNVFALGDGTGGPFGVVICNLLLARSQVATAGAGMRINSANGCKLNNVGVFGDSKMFYGFDVFQTIDAWILGCVVEHTISHAANLVGAALIATSTNAHIFDCQFQYSGGHGISVGDFVVGSSFYRNTLFANAGLGIAMDASNPAFAGGDFEISENNIDSNTAGGVYVDKYGNVRLCDNWFSNNGAANVTIKAAAAQILITSNLMFGSSAITSLDVAGTNVVIAGNVLDGGLNGVLLQAAATSVAVSGNVITQMAALGVNVTSNPSRVAIGSNTFAGNAADISGGGTSVNEAGNSISVPVCMVSRNGVNQVLTAGTIERVNFTTASIDNRGWWDGAVNFRYTPKRAGVYRVNYTVACFATAWGAGFLIAMVRKNGNEVMGGYVNTDSHVNPNPIVVAALVTCNGTTDYIDFAINTGGGPTTPQVDGSDRRSVASIEFVGP